MYVPYRPLTYHLVPYNLPVLIIANGRYSEGNTIIIGFLTFIRDKNTTCFTGRIWILVYPKNIISGLFDIPVGLVRGNKVIYDGE